MKRSKILGAVTGILTAMVPLAAMAEYPERNIELIFPWGPGSAMAASQIVAEAVGEELGVKISVVSTPGGAGVKAFEAALAKPADGYTIIDGWVAPLVLQPQIGNGNWTYKDFIPLWSSFNTPFVLVGRKDETRWSDFQGLIDYMKEHPGELRYSSGSIGNIPHMVMAKIMNQAGVYARNIPYPQDGDAFKDLRGGLLDFTFNNPITYASNKDAFAPLAVMNTREDLRPLFDDAPLVESFGIDMELPGLAPSGWAWWVMKDGTPPEVIATLNDAMAKALAKPDVQEKLADLGFPASLYTPEQYDEIVGPVGAALKSAQDAIAWEDKMLSGN